MKRLDNYVNMLMGGAFSVTDKVKMFIKNGPKYVLDDKVFTIEFKNTDDEGNTTYFIKSNDSYYYNVDDAFIIKESDALKPLSIGVKNNFLNRTPPLNKPISATKEQYEIEKSKVRNTEDLGPLLANAKESARNKAEQEVDASEVAKNKRRNSTAANQAKRTAEAAEAAASADPLNNDKKAAADAARAEADKAEAARAVAEASYNAEKDIKVKAAEAAAEALVKSNAAARAAAVPAPAPAPEQRAEEAAAQRTVEAPRVEAERLAIARAAREAREAEQLRAETARVTAEREAAEREAEQLRAETARVTAEREAAERDRLAAAAKVAAERDRLAAAAKVAAERDRLALAPTTKPVPVAKSTQLSSQIMSFYDSGPAEPTYFRVTVYKTMNGKDVYVNSGPAYPQDTVKKILDAFKVSGKICVVSSGKQFVKSLNGEKDLYTTLGQLHLKYESVELYVL